MAKTTGLGDNFYVGGYDLSGDTNQLGQVGGGPAALDYTDISESAHERIGGLLDARMQWVSFFDPAVGKSHPVLSAHPRTDVQCAYFRGAVLGNPAACMVAKQVTYDPTRATTGELTVAVNAQSNGFGLDWGVQLTAGKRTDTGATNGTGVDTTASASFGGQAYLQVFAFTGTDVTVKIQDSADNLSFTDVAGLAFAQVTAAPNQQRIVVSNTSTIRRYVRAVSVTTGGFTSATFAVVLDKNTVAGVVF